MSTRSVMTRRIDISLDGLHQLLHRIERKELVEGDWAIYGAFVLQLIAREQGKQERMAAKLAASTADGAPSWKGSWWPTEPRLCCLLHWGEDSGTRASGVPDEEPGSKKKAKGHGRNGASAFVNAKHLVHALAVGLVGALCSACGLGRMTRYREKVVIRVVGQPRSSLPSSTISSRPGAGFAGESSGQRPPGGSSMSYIVYDWVRLRDARGDALLRGRPLQAPRDSA